MRLGPIEFVTPPLVEGPKIMFYVPVPEALKETPFVLEKLGGGYGLPVTATVTSTWFIMIILFIIFNSGTKDLKLIPGKLQTGLEYLYSFLDDLVEQMLGKWKVRYISYIAPLFIFILFSNTLSFFPIPSITVTDGIVNIVPAFRSPTADLNTTVGLAFLTTFTFLSTSFRCHGFVGHIKTLFEPMPFMFPINLVGELAKPTNISIRLFGNMFAGMVIIGLIYKAAPVVVPAPLHLYFDIFSGIVQSFVFVMLSLVYIQGALGDTEFDENL
ncbi:MAG: F0F1 ATP synthase subunit A [Fusobacteriaceae bacterium]